MSGFMQTLKIQRWDDHRYYHHSLVNQSLHLLSATSFVLTYFLLFWDPAIAAMIGWIVSMTSRQIGHFFFEPKGYDAVNDATHEYKEEVKGRLQPPPQGCVAFDLGIISAAAVLQADLIRNDSFMGKRTRVCPSDRNVLAVYWGGRSNSAIHSVVLYQRPANRIGLGGQNPD
jgi:hypothetical protein